MPMKHVSLAMAGIGGYARNYFRAIKGLHEAREISFVGYADPRPQQADDWEWVRDQLIPGYGDFGEYLQAGADADLAIISSPPAFHADQACAALRAGMHVLCEKPIAPTVSEALRMREAAEAAGRFLEIGYQWSYSRAIQRLKADILAGRLGAPLRLSTLVSWPRTNAYYARNDWAGQVTDGQGRPVHDSPVNNAAAHYLHNMLYVLGRRIDRSANPVSLTAECYRANPIQCFDTACCRILTSEGVEVLFHASHSVREQEGPIFRFVFEEAVVDYSEDGSRRIRVSYRDGHTEDLGDPSAEPMEKLYHCLRRCDPERALGAICGPEAALAHTRCVEAISTIPVSDFPQDLTRRAVQPSGAVLTCLDGLNEAIREAFARGLLFSEMQLPWASPARYRVISPVSETD